MRTLRQAFVFILGAVAWPAYLLLAAYASRQAPWPRDLAFPVSTTLASLSLAAFMANLARGTLKESGWAERALGMPPEVSRRVRRGALFMIAALVVFYLPSMLITSGAILANGRPALAPSFVRTLTLGFELSIFLIAFWLLRGRSSLTGWLMQTPSRLGIFAAHRRMLCIVVLSGIAAVILLDFRGYSYSARRLAGGAAGSLVVALFCWCQYRLLIRAIDRHAWHWIRVGRALAGRGELEGLGLPDDLAGRLRTLAAYLAGCTGLVLASWVWDVDLALFRFISSHQLWLVGDDDVWITVGDLTKAVFILVVCGFAWRHMSTFFAVVVFPRIPDDPGVRFALVTLCRYSVLGLGLLVALSAVHLGLEKIGVVLAALGVGLGFGLQEIVSNFVCGIILLLERPIRVGDIVTVNAMSGKVDRINIRATTIINSDNQSLIVPNRAFITGDLINWTLKDKIVRVLIRIKVAPGTDPDRVSELLVAIARADADVLKNPAPSALMEEFSDSALVFALSVQVPEPGLAGKVRHRLFSQIQRQFHDAGIMIPLPTQTLIVKPFESPSNQSGATDLFRLDPAENTPPAPYANGARSVPAPVQDCHRGVDE